MLKSIKLNKLTRALNPSSFKSSEQIERDLAYLASLKVRKPSVKPPITEAERMLKAQKARKARMAAKGIHSNTKVPTSLFKPEAQIKLIENPQAPVKYAGFRLGKVNARKVLIGCPVEGGIDGKGRVVENLKVSNNHYNSVVFDAEAQIDPDHTSIAKSIVYGDPALLVELLGELD